jgi:hypothetical protein
MSLGETDLYDFCIKNLKITPLNNFENKNVNLSKYHMNFYVKMINKKNTEETILNINSIQIYTNDETRYKYGRFEEKIILNTDNNCFYEYNNIFKLWVEINNNDSMYDIYFLRIEVLDPIYKSIVYTNNISIENKITNKKNKITNVKNIITNNKILQTSNDNLENLNGPYDSIMANGDIFTYYCEPAKNKIVHVIYKNKDNIEKIYKLNDIYTYNIKNPTSFFKIVGFDISPNKNIFKYIQELNVKYYNKGEIMGAYMGDEKFTTSLHFQILEKSDEYLKNLNGPFESICENEDNYTYYTNQKNKKIVYVIYKKNNSNMENIYKVGDIFANNTRNPSHFYKIVDFELSSNKNIFKYEQEQIVHYSNIGNIMTEYMGDELFMNIYC